ncbi:alpha/beta-hydrolase family protein [Demequina litorisediminis]|uniref:alpha/beta-hydrolase family protein n=1 Tax=Demequina litorisediminis TaxID=1849022 RepID=UPI0024E043D2|nr:alpha/beta-hydrolase family protein [Demequina litorisediminis]
MGRQGRSFVSTGPTASEIDATSAGGALEPVRAYVGLRSADSLEERAQLLLDELIRTDAFDREILVVATTTGTGYLDPHGVDSLEYLWNGDTAIAGMQYSYLPSLDLAPGGPGRGRGDQQGHLPDHPRLLVDAS